MSLLATLLLALSACTSLRTPPPGGTPAGSSAASRGVARTDAAAQTAQKERIAPESATGYRSRPAVRTTQTMVGAANPYASRAGLEILREGGSAIDAAIAMAMVLTLVEPQSSGIGGGAFMLHFDASSSQLVAYDGRETAPAAATPDMFLKDGKPRAFMEAVVGGLSVGVPGELRMLELAHRDQGKLPWARLFEPAIKLAEEGFEISPRLYRLLSMDPVLPKQRAARAYFYGADGKPLPVGTRLVNRPLAEVLRTVAAKGADAFYEGPIADDIVQAVRTAEANPGRLAKEDMAGYRAKRRQAVCGPYHCWQVCGPPPPTSGGVGVIQILGILSHFDLKALAPDSVQAAHLFAEASRLAYADRGGYLADPDFVPVPAFQLIRPGYLEQRAALISPAKSMGVAEAGRIEAMALRWGRDASPELPSTSHMVVVDAAGNAVSMTASVEGAFGSHQMVHGFILNNQLTDFSFMPESDGKPVANRVEPGKRPRSSMAPIIVLDQIGQHLVMALGSPGGPQIIDYVAQPIMSVEAWGMDLQQAFDRPHVVNRNGVTELEPVPGGEAWLKEVSEGLKVLGHQVEVKDENSGLQGIMRIDGGYLGGADPRREGVILGD
jgi:gamma-glutamyltranspeptidase/glutathione hydrolase